MVPQVENDTKVGELQEWIGDNHIDSDKGLLPINSLSLLSILKIDLKRFILINWGNTVKCDASLQCHVDLFVFRSHMYSLRLEDVELHWCLVVPAAVGWPSDDFNIEFLYCRILMWLSPQSHTSRQIADFENGRREKLWFLNLFVS